MQTTNNKGAPRNGTHLVKAEYHGIAVAFTEDAWFNATAVAERFEKTPVEWLRLPSSKEYIEALERRYGKIPYVKTSRARSDRGGGTWLHPKLAIRFSQWLDIDFAIWCDDQIYQILTCNHPHYDWKKLRHEASASYKVMGQILQMTRQRLGKTCAPHHFSNEARLVNWALTGAFVKVDRDGLSTGDLDLLAKLESMNSVLIGCAATYDERKQELEQFASEQRAVNAPRLEAACAP
jgi:hypothetical protein